MRSTLLLAAALCGGPVLLSAQSRDTTSGPVLTLDQAITLATRNNPDYLQVLNNRKAASAELRAAYGTLLPEVDASLNSTYRQGGAQVFQGQTFGASSNTYQSSYFFGVNYRLNGSSFLLPGQQRANVEAVEADIKGTAELVRATVSQQYLTVLQSQAKAALQDSLVKSQESQLELAKAKSAVGSGTQLDVARAEVTLGQQRVAALQAHNQVEIDKLRLFQRIGVTQPANVQLTSTFTVAEPTFVLDDLLGIARKENPTLNALRSRDRVSTYNVRLARSEYLPTLSLSTGKGGYAFQYADPNFLVKQAEFGGQARAAGCVVTDSIRRGAGLAPLGGCDALLLSDAQAASIRAQNSQFPFSFTKQPLAFSASLSLPIFNGFTREQHVAEAQANRDDARYRIRAGELQLTADVTAAYLTLVTQARTVAQQEQNVAKAKEELRLAQERYKVGASTFLEVTTAQASYEQAENDRINAIFEYHKAFAALESAVGRPLR